MSTSIRFLGVAGYEIVGPDYCVIVDPFLTGSPATEIRPTDLATPDVILVTHAAFDHYGDVAEIARLTGAPVVCGGDVRLMLLDEGIPAKQIRATIWGVAVEVTGVLVRPVECHHWSMGTLSDGTPVTGAPLAFIFETEPGVRLYHYGDSSIFDMNLIAELYRPTVAFLGCSDPPELEADVEAAGRLVSGEMTPDEAARVAEMLTVDVAVPCHYLSRTPDVDEFLQRVPTHDARGDRAAIALDIGETLVVEGHEGRARVVEVSSVGHARSGARGK